MTRVTMSRTLTIGIAGALLLGLAGCYTPGGPRWSADQATYMSTAWEPKTVTIYDSRTGEVVFAVDIPVGKKLTIRFAEGSGPNEDKPDELVWEVQDADKNYGTMRNRMACPSAEHRRVEMTLRDNPSR